jgi:hypothetical protein
MIVAVCARKEDDCQNPDGRDHYMFDTGMATAFLLLRATELGLVAHPIAGYDHAGAKKALSIPDEYTLITLVIVGKHGSDLTTLSEKQIEREFTFERMAQNGVNVVDYWMQFGECTLETEGKGTVVRTAAGGRTEVLGTLLLAVGEQPYLIRHGRDRDT